MNNTLIKQQSPIEWLKEKWLEQESNLCYEDFELAEIMFKKQIMKSHYEGLKSPNILTKIDSEEYYNQTYNK